MKKLNFALLALCFASISINAQLNVNIKNGIVLKYEGGFIVSGLIPEKKGMYEVSTYDNDLKKKKSTEINVDKLDYVYVSYANAEIMVVSRKNMFDKSSTQYKLDTNLAVISQKSYTKEEVKAEQDKGFKQVNTEAEINKTNYLPGNYLDMEMRGFEPTMKVGQWLVDFKWDNSVPIPPPPAVVGLNEPYAYKGKGKLLILEQKKEDNRFYNVLNQIEIPGKIKQYKLIPWNQEKVFLYISLWINENSMEEIIYGIDVKQSLVIFKKSLSSTSPDHQLCFSNAVFDNNTGKLIVAGNYINKTTKKKDLLKSGTQNMEGYFFLWMDDKGNFSKQYEYPLSSAIADPAVLKKISRRAMKIQEILILGKGSYKIIGEELQFSYGGPSFSNLTGGSSSSDPSKNMTTGAMDYFQTMGFTVIDFTLDGQNSVSSQQIKNYSDKLTDWKYDTDMGTEITSWANDQTIFSTLLKYDNAVYKQKVKLAYTSCSENGKSILYSSGGRYIHLSDGKYSIVPISYNGYTIVYPLKKVYFISDVSKTSLSINKFSF